MPYSVNGGPLDGGLFDFDVMAPGRVTVALPLRYVEPSVAVHENDGGTFRFVGWQDGGDDLGVGVTP